MDCANRLIGQELVARAPSLSEGRESAAREAHIRLSSAYAKKTEDAALAVSDLYDKITNHGTNTVTTSSGVEEAIEQSNRTHP
jgi:hypothetical protein